MKKEKYMYALQFTNTGEANDVLSLNEVKIPEPGENEIRVKVVASPINPADLLFINGKYRQKPQFPQIAGIEGAGIIDKVGKNVTLQIGDLVSFRHKCAWAEYVILPLDKIISLPKNFPLDKACQMSLNPITAYALLEESKLKRNDWLLITAGNSAIAKIIVQLAKLKSINTILVVRKLNETDRDELKKIGANAVFDTDTDNLLESIAVLTNSKGINCIMDAVGGNTTTQLITSMASGGSILSYGLLSKESVYFHNSDIIFKNISIKGFGVDNWLNSTRKTKLRKMYSYLIETIQQSEFKMPSVKKYKLTDFKTALKNYSTHVNGKLVFLPNE